MNPNERRDLMDAGRIHSHGGQATPRVITEEEKAWLARQPLEWTPEDRERMDYEFELQMREEMARFYEDEEDE